MSGRMNRVKEAISRTMTTVGEQATKSGNAYICGYHNGIAMVDHHLSGRSGDAKERFILPRMASPEPTTTEDEITFAKLQDDVIVALRAHVGAMHPDEIRLDTAARDVIEKLQALDAFIDRLETGGRGEIVSESDAISKGQEGSTPSPASPLLSDAGFASFDVIWLLVVLSFAGMGFMFASILGNMIPSVFP